MHDITSIQDIQGGAAIKMFDDALAKVIKNILDPNTKATKARKVTLTVTLAPNDTRELGDIDIAVEATIAPPRSKTTRLFFGERNSGDIMARESELNQGDLFDGESNVHPIGGGAK